MSLTLPPTNRQALLAPCLTLLSPATPVLRPDPVSQAAGAQCLYALQGPAFAVRWIHPPLASASLLMTFARGPFEQPPRPGGERPSCATSVMRLANSKLQLAACRLCMACSHSL